LHPLWLAGKTPFSDRNPSLHNCAVQTLIINSQSGLEQAELRSVVTARYGGDVG